MKQYDYYNNILQDVSKPCAFLDLELFEKNIKEIQSRANGKNIRIASKSLRNISALHAIFQASTTFKGVMCFTGEEAIYLYENGFDDLLIAYPIVEENVLRKICQLVQKGATITVMVDCEEHIALLEKIAKEEEGYFLVCIDIDLSTNYAGLHFGVQRSPLRKIKSITKFIDLVLANNFIVLDGLMGYEAQIAGVTDKDPDQKMRSTLVRQLKKQSTQAIRKKRKQIYRYLEKRDVQVRFVNGGGTGSLHETAEDKTVTEVTVGSGFYQSHLFDKYVHINLTPALAFAVEITRKPEKELYTCFGGGYVASGATGKDKLPEIYLPKGAKLTENEGVGEVQTPVIYKGKKQLELGDTIIFRHSKAGELCERFQVLHVIKDGQIIDQWKTYRGDGKCFL
ncbi:MAG TPA: amino acid deaminase/aldolase [Pseudogracilibacillus sp.]|nr:amino acid deaminase/aldolase [Pseudogracilibacillus sp.]